MASYLRAPPATPTERSASASCSSVTPMTRRSTSDATRRPSASKKRRQMSPTAPRSPRPASSASEKMLPLLCSRRRRLERADAHERERHLGELVEGRAHEAVRACSASRDCTEWAIPGASMNVGRAPVRSANRCVSRAACASAAGLPTPPKSWTARSAPAFGQRPHGVDRRQQRGAPRGDADDVAAGQRRLEVARGRRRRDRGRCPRSVSSSARSRPPRAGRSAPRALLERRLHARRGRSPWCGRSRPPPPA